MRLPKSDGSFPDADDDIYDDVPATKGMKAAALLALVDQVIDGKEDGIMLAGAKATDWDRVPEDVEKAYNREAKRIAEILSKKHGAPIVSTIQEIGFIGYRWTVRGVPIVLAPYQEDSDLPFELFLMRVTTATKIYLAPSLTRPAPKTKTKTKTKAKAKTKTKTKTKAPAKKKRRT